MFFPETDHCLHVEALANSSTQDPYLSRLHFENYCRYGLILGEDEEKEIRNGAMWVVTANRLHFSGGPGNPSGILLNAQNAELVNFFSLFFAPRPGMEHSHHIRQVGGGVQIYGMASTRARGSAILSRQQLGIYGWRSEDRFLVTQEVADPGGPSIFANVHQRHTPVNEAEDAVFDLNHSRAFQTFQSVRIQGSIRVGHLAARHVNAQGVSFDLDGAGYRLRGPVRNQRGIFHDGDEGSWRLQGTSPSIDFRLSQGSLGDPDTPAGTLTGVRGISSDSEECRNLRGLATIRDDEAHADVRLRFVETDAAYHVVATVNEACGDVPANALILYISHKEKHQFRLNVLSPPGMGNKITIAWIMIR